MKVGIIGLGVIGKAQVRLFSGHEIVTYDPLHNADYPYDALAGCEFAVICVGTPPARHGESDLSQVIQARDALPKTVPVMLRSTVPPGTVGRLFTDLDCFVPEFMGENPAHPWQESADVPYLLLGGSIEARAYFRNRIAQVFPGEVYECTALEAELAKYTANLYWATRVTFVNEMALICKRFGADFERVRAAWLRDPRMTAPYTAREGHPAGFGGRCWPKDLSALVSASREAGYKARFLEAIEDANARFTG